MAIFTFEQALKRTGAKPAEVNSTNQVVAPVKEPGAVSTAIQNTRTGMKNFATDSIKGTADAAKSAFQGLQGDVQSAAEGLSSGTPMGGAKAFVRGGVGTISDLAKLILSPITGTISASVKNIADASSEIKPLQDLAMSKPVSGGLDAVETVTNKLKEIEQKHPDLIKGLMDSINVALIAAGGSEKGGIPAEKTAPLNEYVNKIEATHTTGVAAPQPGSNISSSISSVKDDILNNFSSRGLNADPKITNAISQLDPSKFSSVKDFSNAVRESIKTASSGVSPIGSDIAQTKADLSGAADAVTGTIKNSVRSVTEPISTGVSDAVSAVRNKVNPVVTEESRLSSAIKDATPNYETATTKERQKLLSRAEEGGVLRGRSVTPTKLESEAGKELLKVPGYDPEATKLEKYQRTKQEVTRRAVQLETDLGKEKIIVPKKEVVSIVRNAINDVPNESLLLQKSDPAIKNYLRVLNNAASESEGTLQGVLKLRKKLDAAYENARGSQAFGSDKIAALDEVHTASRDALTKYLIEHASTDVAGSLKSQWDLYRALDQLKIAAEKESGSTVGRLIQKFPLLTKIVETGARATGLGSMINIIK